MPELSLVAVLLLALAAYRITRAIVEDDIFDWLRVRVWKRFPPETKFGYLFTCYWCMGFWVSSLVVLTYIIVPVPMMVISLILALSAITGIIAARLDR